MAPGWTYEQCVAYEAAKEALTSVAAALYARLYREEAKPIPDHARIATLNNEIRRLREVEKELRLHDATAVAQVRREFGQRLRDLRSEPCAAA